MDTVRVPSSHCTATRLLRVLVSPETPTTLILPRDAHPYQRLCAARGLRPLTDGECATLTHLLARWVHFHWPQIDVVIDGDAWMALGDPSHLTALDLALADHFDRFARLARIAFATERNLAPHLH
jgi:hypothetical protein